MSAFREAVLSVTPKRLEQFTMEVKKNISDKSTKSVKRNRSSSSHSKNLNSHKTKKRSKRSDDKTSKTSVEGESKSLDKQSSKPRRHSSSTHNKSPSRKSSPERKKGKQTKSKDKEDSDFDKNDLDLSVPMYPLCSLVKDRGNLLDTIFTIIKGPKLTSMLPDILKLMPLEEIKHLCLEQLEVMSSKRILHVLSGEEMNSSSGTESSDNDQAARRNKSQDPALSRTQQEGSLQTNFVDSTTDEPSSSAKAMLFPSALSTAQHKSEIPVKQVSNDNTEQNTVSTSTEPNFIYSAEGGQEVDSEPGEDSDPEEGEVRSSSNEDDEKTEKPCDEEHHHIEEEVLVEEELVEEDENQVIEQDPPVVPGAKRKRKVVVKTKSTKTLKRQADDISEEINGRLDNDGTPQTGTDGASVPNSKQPESVAAAHSPETTEEQDPYAGKTQLEILELEMRARAIRSLMRAAQANKLKAPEK